MFQRADSVVKPAENESIKINPWPVGTQLYTAPVTSDFSSISGYLRRCIHLRLVPSLGPSPVSSDVASISCYFRRWVHLLLLPTLRPSVTFDVASICYFRRCVHLLLLPTLGSSPVTSAVAPIHCSQNSSTATAIPRP